MQAGEIADDTHLVVVGSQAVLGSYPEAPGEPLVSMGADVCKLAVGQEKDMDFVRGLLTHDMVSTRMIEERIGQVQRGGEQARESMRMRLRSILSRRGP